MKQSQKTVTQIAITADLKCTRAMGEPFHVGIWAKTHRGWKLATKDSTGHWTLDTVYSLHTLYRTPVIVFDS